MTATLLPNAKQAFNGPGGQPLVGGMLYTYAAGTNTPLATYVDAAGVTANTNPIILDARGEAVIFWSGSYKIVLRDALGNLIWSLDDVVTGPTFSDATGAAGIGIAGGGTVQSFITNLMSSAGSLVVGFIQNATGAKSRTVQDKLREWVSLEDFGALGDGVSVPISTRYATIALARADYPFLTTFDYANRTMEYAASRAMSLFCASTGVTASLRGGVNYLDARIEMHGSWALRGNGAKIQYLGIGNTYIAGTGSGTAAVFTPWPTTDTDGMADVYPVSMFNVTVGGTGGVDATLTLSNVAGLAKGMWVFVADNPAGNSSPTNAIPSNFDYHQILYIVGNVVTFTAALTNTYTTTACVFYCAGLALNCSARDLTLTSLTDAYLHVVRSALNVRLDNILFAGESAVGASTFAKDLYYTNCTAPATYGPLSCARGTFSTFYNGFSFGQRANLPPAQKQAIFIEESCYHIGMRAITVSGAGVKIGSIQLNAPQRARLITLDDFDIDASNAVTGSGFPLAVASMQGVSFVIGKGVAKGTQTQPDSSDFPGASPCIFPISTITAADSVKIGQVHFISTNAGPTISIGGGMAGRILGDPNCTFDTALPFPASMQTVIRKSGTVTLTATTAPVVFASMMPTPFYNIQLSTNAPPVSWSSKGQSGFTINGLNGATVDWSVSSNGDS